MLTPEYIQAVIADRQREATLSQRNRKVIYPRKSIILLWAGMVGRVMLWLDLSW